MSLHIEIRIVSKDLYKSNRSLRPHPVMVLPKMKFLPFPAIFGLRLPVDSYVNSHMKTRGDASTSTPSHPPPLMLDPMQVALFSLCSVSSNDPIFRQTPSTSLTRPTSIVSTTPQSLPSFLLGPANRSYKHQYANIYFIRLRKLRQFVERNAKERWQKVKGK